MVTKTIGDTEIIYFKDATDAMLEVKKLNLQQKEHMLMDLVWHLYNNRNMRRELTQAFTAARSI